MADSRKRSRLDLVGRPYSEITDRIHFITGKCMVLAGIAFYAEYKDETIVELCLRIMIILVVIACPIFIYCCYMSVKQYHRAVIFRFGKVRRDCPSGPGIIWKLPCIDDVWLVDIRSRTIDLPRQEVLTKDSVTVQVDAVVYYHVLRPLHALLYVEDHHNATELISVAILRNILGQYPLTELLSSRDIISSSSKLQSDVVTSEWGVEVERVEIKDVSLPPELQKAMAAEAEGTRIAKAKIIEAEGEIKTAENLKEASLLMMENPQIILVRYLQTLNYIAAQQKTSILFPFPLDIPEPK